MAKGGAVEGIIPPEEFGVSPPLPMSGSTLSTCALGGCANASGGGFPKAYAENWSKEIQVVSEDTTILGDVAEHDGLNYEQGGF